MTVDDTPRLPRDVLRHGHYLFQHLCRADIAAFVGLDVGPGELVPLHQVGCSPGDLARYRQAGLTNNRHVIRLRACGWSPEYLAATGLDPHVALGYLACGITVPTKMRRLIAVGAPPEAISPYIASSGFCSTIAAVAPLPEIELTVDGAFGPLRLAVTDGLLEAAGTDAVEDLQDESAMAVLGRDTEPSPALHLVRQWRRGIHADWDDLAGVLGLGDDGATTRLRWLRSVLDAANTRFDGHLPALPRLAPPPPCPACIERRAFVEAREEAYRNSLPATPTSPTTPAGPRSHRRPRPSVAAA